MDRSPLRVLLDNELMKELDAVACKRGKVEQRYVTRSELARLAIVEYLHRVAPVQVSSGEITHG